MAIIISILNYKGGVGKTTTTISLGTALWILGKKVLLIDSDQQCNLSGLLGFSQTEGDNTLSEWLLDDKCSAPVYQHYDGMHYIPASKKLKETQVYMMNRMNRERILSKKLNKIRDTYDYILIDCAPNDGLINSNALSASDKILIPMECAGFSLQGMQDLLDSINEVKENINEGLDILGFLVTKYNSKTRISRKILAFFDKAYPDKVFRTKIRNSVKFDETPLQNQSIFEYFIESNGAEDYMRLAEEITGEYRPCNWKGIAITAWTENYLEESESAEKGIE